MQHISRLSTRICLPGPCVQCIDKDVFNDMYPLAIYCPKYHEVFFMQMINMQRPLTPGPSFKNQTYPSKPLRKISQYALVLIYQSCKTFLFLELGYKTL